MKEPTLKPTKQVQIQLAEGEDTGLFYICLSVNGTLERISEGFPSEQAAMDTLTTELGCVFEGSFATKAGVEDMLDKLDVRVEIIR